MKPKQKRRSRTPSLEAEIRTKARQIYADGMADAMKAAALMIVGRKLDEIRTILQSAGINGTASSVATAVPRAVASSVQRIETPVEHPCTQCGRESVRKTRPNKFNPTGSWYCEAHRVLAAQSDYEDVQDAQLMGASVVAGPSIVKKPAVVIQTHAPARMVAETRPEPVPEAQMQPTSTGPQDAPGGGSLDEAMAALGVVQ